MRTLIPANANANANANATRPPQDPAGYMTRPALLAAFIPLSSVKDARDEINTALSSLKESPGSIDFLKQVLTHCNRLVLHREFPEEKPGKLDKAAETIVKTLEHSGARTTYFCSPGKVDGFTNRFSALMKSINRYCENNAFNTDEGPDCFGTLCEILRSEKDGTAWSETSLKKHIRNAFNSLPERNEEAQYAEVGTFTDCADKLLNSWEESHASWFEPGELSDKHCSPWVRDDTSWRETKAPSQEAKESSQKPVKTSQNQEPSWRKPDQSWRVYDVSEAETYQHAEFDKTRNAIAAVQKGDPSDGHEKRILHTATYCVLQHLLPEYDPRDLTPLARNMVKLLAYKQENTDLINALGDMHQGFRGQVNFAGLARYIKEKGIPGEQGGLKEAMGFTSVTSRPQLRYTLNNLADWTSRLIEHCASGAGSNGFPLPGLIHPQERPAEPSATQKVLDRVNAYHTMPQAAKNVARTIGHVAGVPGVQAVSETPAYKQYKEDWDFLIEKCLDNILTLAFAERQKDLKSSEPLIKAIKEVLGEEADGFLLRSIKEQAGRIRLNKDIVDAKNRLTARETTRNNAEKELTKNEESLRSISTKRPNPNALHYAREAVSVSKNLVAHCNDGVRDAKQALEKAQKSLEEYDGMATGINFDALVKGDWRELKKKVRHIRDRAKQGVFRFSPNASLGTELLGTLVTYFEQASSRLSAQILGGPAYAKTQSAINKMKEDSLVQAALFTAQSLPQGVRDAWKVKADIPLLPYEGMSESEQGKVRDEINNIRTITDFLAAPGPDKYDNAEEAVKSLDRLANPARPYAAIGAGPAIPAVQPPQTHDAKMASLNDFLVPETKIPVQNPSSFLLDSASAAGTVLKGLFNKVDSVFTFPGAEASPTASQKCHDINVLQNHTVLPASDNIPSDAPYPLKLKNLSEMSESERAQWYDVWNFTAYQVKSTKIDLARYFIYDQQAWNGPSIVNYLTEEFKWDWGRNALPVGALIDYRPQTENDQNSPSDFPPDKVFYFTLKDRMGKTLFEKGYKPISSLSEGKWHKDVCEQILEDMSFLPEMHRISIGVIAHSNDSHGHEDTKLEEGILASNHENFFISSKNSKVTDATWEFKSVNKLPYAHRMDSPAKSIQARLNQEEFTGLNSGIKKRQRILDIISTMLPDEHLSTGDKVIVDGTGGNKTMMTLDHYLYDDRWKGSSASFLGHSTPDLGRILNHEKIRQIYKTDQLNGLNQEESERIKAILCNAGLNQQDIESITPYDTISLTFSGTNSGSINTYIYDIYHFSLLLHEGNVFGHLPGNFISLGAKTDSMAQKLKQVVLTQIAAGSTLNDREQNALSQPASGAVASDTPNKSLNRTRRYLISVPDSTDYPKNHRFSGKVPVKMMNSILWVEPHEAVERREALVPGMRVDKAAVKRYEILMQQTVRPTKGHTAIIHAPHDYKPPSRQGSSVITKASSYTARKPDALTTRKPDALKFKWDIENFFTSETISIDFVEDRDSLGSYQWVHGVIDLLINKLTETINHQVSSEEGEKNIRDIFNEAQGLTLDISVGYAPTRVFSHKVTVNPSGNTLTSYLSQAKRELYENIDSRSNLIGREDLKFIEAQLIYPAIKVRTSGLPTNINANTRDRISKELSENNGDADASPTIRALAKERREDPKNGSKYIDLKSAEKSVVTEYYAEMANKVEIMQKMLLTGVRSEREFLARELAKHLGLDEKQWPVIAMQTFRVKTKSIRYPNRAHTYTTDVYDGLTNSTSVKGRTLLDMLYDIPFRNMGSWTNGPKFVEDKYILSRDLANALNVTSKKDVNALAERIHTLFDTGLILHNDGFPEPLKHPEEYYSKYLNYDMDERIKKIKALEVEKLILSSPVAIEDLANVKGNLDELCSYLGITQVVERNVELFREALRGRFNSDEFQDLQSNWTQYLGKMRAVAGFIPVIGNELSLILDIAAGDNESAAINAIFCLLAIIPEGGALGSLAKSLEAAGGAALATKGLVEALRSRDPDAIMLAMAGAAMTAPSVFHCSAGIARHFSEDPIVLSNGRNAESVLYKGKTVPAVEHQGQKSPAIHYENELYAVFKSDGSPVLSLEFNGVRYPAISVKGESIPVIWYQDKFIRAEYDHVSEILRPAVIHHDGSWGIATEHNGELVPALHYGDKLAPTAVYNNELCPLIEQDDGWVFATIKNDELVPALRYDGESYIQGETSGSWVPTIQAPNGDYVPAVRLNDRWVRAGRYKEGWAPLSTDSYMREGIILAKHNGEDVVVFQDNKNFKVIISEGDGWKIAKIEGDELIVDPEATVRTQEIKCRFRRVIEPSGTRDTGSGHIPTVRFTPQGNVVASPFDFFKTLQLINAASYAEKIKVEYPPHRPHAMNQAHDFAPWFADRTSTIARQDHRGEPKNQNVMSDATVGEYALLRGELVKLSVQGPIMEAGGTPIPVQYNPEFPVEISAQQGIFYEVRMSDVCPTFSGDIYGGMSIAQSKSNPAVWYGVTAVENSGPNGQITLKHYYAEFRPSQGATSPLARKERLIMKDISSAPDALAGELIHLHDRSVMVNQLATIYGKEQLSNSIEMISNEMNFAPMERVFEFIKTDTTEVEQFMFDSFDLIDLKAYDGNFYHEVVVPSIKPRPDRPDYQGTRLEYNTKGDPHNVDLAAIAAKISRYPNSGTDWTLSQNSEFAAEMMNLGVTLDTPLQRYRFYLYLKIARLAQPTLEPSEFANVGEVFARWATTEASISEAFDDLRLSVTHQILERGRRRTDYNFSSAENPEGISSALAVGRLTGPQYDGITFKGVNGVLSDAAGIQWEDGRIFRHGGSRMAQRHAEEMLVNEVHDYFLKNGIHPTAVRGELIVMVDKNNGVCASCRAGLVNEGGQPSTANHLSPITEFSREYPNLEIKFQVRKLANYNSGSFDFSVQDRVRTQCY